MSIYISSMFDSLQFFYTATLAVLGRSLKYIKKYDFLKILL